MKRIALFGLLAILTTTACSSHSPKQGAEAEPLPAIKAQVAEVQTTQWPVTSEATGTVRAITAAPLSSKVMAYVREITVNAGDPVVAGQLLVVLDTRDLDTGVQQAKAAAEEATSGIGEADNAIAGAKAQLHLAEVTFRRMDDLFRKKSISNQEFDEAQARLQSAEAAHQMAISRRAQLNSKINQARQAADLAAVNRSYAEIRAPFAGVITERRAEPGQVAAPGTPLLTLERSGGYRFEASVEESLVGQLRQGQQAAIVLDALGRTMQGRIAEIVPAIDPASRTFIVKVSLPADRTLRSGLFGRMRLQRGARQAIVIPDTAIARHGQVENVFLVESGIARSRMISTGARQDARTEILSGLQPGETIVTVVPPNLADGRRVEAVR